MSLHRSASIILIIGLFAASLPVATAAGAPTLNMGQVVLTSADHSPVSPDDISAFVPTLSSGLCHITLAESNFAVPGTAAFCGVRQVDGVYGVFIHIFLPYGAPTDALWVVNVYQERARAYGAPIAYVDP